MNNEKLGQFILELRKAKQMTQKDLAAKLNITDKAVSKWERGISCPDISLLSAIAEVLGVTTGELLNGERSKRAAEDVAESMDHVLHYADKTAKHKVKSFQNICAIAFSSLLFLGIVVCAICDMAISGAFTWSLIPIASIVFAWLTFFPVIKWGGKGIWGTMIALSILIIPFLYVLDNLIPATHLILPIGIRMSVIGIVFLWIIFALFKTLKTRKRLAAAATLLLTIPVNALVNFSLANIIAEPLFDLWDLVSVAIIVIAAAILFILDVNAHKKQS